MLNAMTAHLVVRTSEVIQGRYVVQKDVEVGRHVTKKQSVVITFLYHSYLFLWGRIGHMIWINTIHCIWSYYSLYICCTPLLPNSISRWCVTSLPGAEGREYIVFTLFVWFLAFLFVQGLSQPSFELGSWNLGTKVKMCFGKKKNFLINQLID